MVNILLIGLGYHARRIYFPVLLELRRRQRLGRIFIIDLKSQEDIILKYLAEKDAKDFEIFLLEKPENSHLTKGTVEVLNKIRAQIAGVIISTEPLAHLVYAEWALKQKLSVLMDKPISTKEGIIRSENLGKSLISDFYKLVALYQKVKSDKVVFTVMAQRRFHNGFKKIKEAIAEVFQKTNCPITSIQVFHGDGQWRLPTEIVDQDYHSFNKYGKCSHSGYHFFDIVSWLMESAESDEKKLDEVEIVSSFSVPRDFIEQITYNDYQKYFPDFDKYNKYTEKQFKDLSVDFGEMDVFNNFVFKKRDRVITLANINLCHNSFSQRNWATAQGRDLYKGNGRVRHESYYILQGPFQAISVFSYQSKEVDPNLQKDLFVVGGEYHFDIHIFRNSSLRPKWKCVDCFSIKDLTAGIMEGWSRGHQEDARRVAVLRFFDFLIAGDARIIQQSDLLQCERSVKMMSGACQSMAKRKKGRNPLVKIKL